MDRSSFAAYIQAAVPITGPELAEILAAYEPRILRKNEFLLHQGEVSNDYLFLEAGLLRAFTLDPDGNEITTFFYARNQMVFEVASLFTRATSGESIQALTDCRGYSLTLDKLNALFHGNAAFREFGRKMLVRGFAGFKQRALALVNTRADAVPAPARHQPGAVLARPTPAHCPLSGYHGLVLEPHLKRNGQKAGTELISCQMASGLLPWASGTRGGIRCFVGLTGAGEKLRARARSRLHLLLRSARRHSFYLCLPPVPTLPRRPPCTTATTTR